MNEREKLQQKLRNAIKSDSTATVLQLVKEERASVHYEDEEGNTALNQAVLFNNTKMAKCLIDECNADMNTENKEGRTPLRNAHLIENPELVRYLESKEAPLIYHRPALSANQAIIAYLMNKEHELNSPTDPENHTSNTSPGPR